MPWIKTDDGTDAFQCLACGRVFPNVEEFLVHCEEDHEEDH